MEILTQLGINITAVYQFGIYILSFVIFYYLIFKPYFEAYSKRIETTVGSQENSEKLVAQTEELKLEFDKKTQEVNQSYKEIFDKEKLAALAEHDRIMSESRDKSNSLIANTREKIKVEIDKTRAELNQHIPQVTSQVVEKLL